MLRGAGYPECEGWQRHVEHGAQVLKPLRCSVKERGLYPGSLGATGRLEEAGQ